jgi:sulfur-oxidizing protein SoxY
MTDKRFLKHIRIVALTSVLLLTASLSFAQSADDLRTMDFNTVMTAIGADQAEYSDNIVIKTPKIAENGSVVPITVSTTLKDVKKIYLVVKENPSPLAASFTLGGLALPLIKNRVKMSKPSDVIVVVEAGDKVYKAKEFVKVTIGGCGGGDKDPS